MSKIIYSKEFDLGFFQVFNDKPNLENLIHVHQIHSSDIEDYIGNDISIIQSDGIFMTNDVPKNMNFAIKTADCLPVLFLGHKGIVFLHAGWAGIQKKILTHPQISKIEPYYCFIGPSIHVKNFEVQEDFYQHFPDKKHFIKIENKLYFNLQSQASENIRSQFPNIILENSDICTFEHLEFNSYRRDKTKQRNWNIFSFKL